MHSLLAAALVAALAQSPAPAAAPPAPTQPNPITHLFQNLGDDLRALPSTATAITLLTGSAAALAAHNNDIPARDWALRQPGDSHLASFGNLYGDGYVHAIGAIATWAGGKAARNAQWERLGADLIRGQALNGLTTKAVKLVAQRERPDHGSQSFPSGHTSAAFTTATVVGRDFGYRASLPFYGLGALVGWGRVRSNHHWLSDTVIGAAVGVASGLTVTRGASNRWTVSAVGTTGGAAVYLSRTTPAVRR